MAQHGPYIAVSPNQPTFQVFQSTSLISELQVAKFQDLLQQIVSGFLQRHPPTQLCSTMPETQPFFFDVRPCMGKQYAVSMGGGGFQEQPEVHGGGVSTVQSYSNIDPGHLLQPAPSIYSFSNSSFFFFLRKNSFCHSFYSTETLKSSLTVHAKLFYKLRCYDLSLCIGCT